MSFVTTRIGMSLALELGVALLLTSLLAAVRARRSSRLDWIPGFLLLAGLATITHAGHLEAQDSSELQRLYEADQADRRHSSPPTPEIWAEISRRDATRRARVLELVRADSVRTAADFYHAAMVLQHGEGSEDILLAHILATAAAFAGDDRGRWLSAASLDRYLHRTRSPQRLGTQYLKSRESDPYTLDPAAPWSQGPYEDWLPDSIRKVFGVPPLASQIERVRTMNRGGSG